MASESSLRARRTLVWETRDISKHQKESSVFSLMQNNWILQINPVYGTGRFSPSSYNIKLKNCSGIPSFQPFEVVTFLVDRRSNAQMHCSKLTVSCACEILFKESFDSTYEKLPGLKLYDDVAILCTFYPSTGLALCPQSIRGSSLRIRHSIVWKTGRPTLYEKKESPMFNLKDSKWKLELHLANSTLCRSSVYHINLKNSSGVQSCQPFDVETYLVDRKNFVQIWCSRLTVSSISEVLYKASINSIYEELPGLKFSGEVTIVCAFGASIGSSFSEKMENDIAVTTECLQCKSQSTYHQGDIAQCTSSHSLQSLKFLPDFENMSNDFAFMLDNNVMTDMEFLCGGKVIPAHKAIVAARSPFFSAVLKRPRVETKITIIEIIDIEPCVLWAFLKYLYTGKISDNLSVDVLCRLYIASGKYSVKSLQKMCSSYMTKKVNTENYIKFLILADSHNSDKELIEAVADFIRGKSELLMNDIWIRFSSEFPNLANEVYRIHMMNTLKISSVK